MSWGSQLVDHVVGEAHHEAQQVINRLPAGIRGEVQKISNALAKATKGIPGIGGGANRGPAHKVAGIPVYGGSTFSPKGPPRPADTEYKCCYNADGSPCAGRRPFPFLMKLVVTAGAHAAGASLGQFIKTANCDQITVDQKFPNNAITEIAKVTISTGLSATESDAVLATFYIVEKHAGAEVARYPLLDLFPLVTRQFSDATGSASSQQKYDNAGVAFPQAWDPNTEYELELFSSVDINTTDDVAVSLGLSGTIRN